ncbi:MAG: efflux RND transporter periplasmic adaptor subunit [Deltaproteobacteria bacterium]|nr:efflux RND transporter periplasmic adaptor subunit [Deltaproteobacteria bacterium]PXF56091.1 MAG: hypothetical protein C4B57_01195 [Deltaproteobacteria bacterium]RKX59436.1 MAG: hypothetical protein DRP28_03150 [Thermodesulfobacteriota bacterium]
MIRKIAIFFLLIVLIAGGVMVVKKKKMALEKVPPPEKNPIVVNASRIEYGEFPEIRRYLGTIRAKVASDISPRISGHIIQVRVREGDIVKKGDLLTLIDDREQRDRINEFEARLSAAKTAFAAQGRIYSRDKKLFDAKAISQEALDKSKAARDAAWAEVKTLEAALDTAETELSYTRLKAPFDGVITERLQDPGDLSLPGKAVLSMEATKSGYYIEVKVPQDEFPLLKKGLTVWLSMEKRNGATGNEAGRLKLALSRLHPSVKTGTLATLEADIDTRPFGLPAGATVETGIEAGFHKGFKVPVRAILENVDASYCFLVDQESRIHVKEVSVLYQGPEFAVISGKGLRAGARVVVAQESALLRLHEGQQVKVLEAVNADRA